MNQNRNQNRRRGRGGNRGQGGGNQGNRIDSRARGNAPQLLEKYKKLAHDASLNGDRVQTEYYLQFADHYFRVVADSRAQREEQRPRRDQDRDDERESANDEADTADEREEADNARRSPSRRRDRNDDDDARAEEGERGVEGDEAEADADDNPFVRDARSRRSRSRGRGGRNSDAAEGGDESGFDAGILPPSIARNDDSQARPARPRTRRSRPTEDDGGEEAFEAAS